MHGYFLMRRAQLLVGALLLAGGSTLSNANAWATEANQAASEAERNKQVVGAAFDRWSAGGSTFFSEILSPDIVWTIEGSGPSAGTYRGLADFTARAITPFVSRLREPVRPVSKRIWADGEHVIIHWEGEGVARDGRSYRNSYAWIFRMADGRAVEATAFLDLSPYDDVIRRIPASAQPPGALPDHPR